MKLIKIIVQIGIEIQPQTLNHLLKNKTKELYFLKIQILMILLQITLTSIEYLNKKVFRFLVNLKSIGKKIKMCAQN
jgi:hypothetical protein